MTRNERTKKFDDVLRTMLGTPPDPHKPQVKPKRPKKKTKKPA